MASIFTKIVQGEIPCYKIAEDEHFLAFLDVFPTVKGHTLVIPKQETDYIFDLADDTLANLNVFAKKVALALQKYTNCARVSVVVAGFEVPHAHIHLIPSNSMQDLQFMQKLKFTPEEFNAIAAGIRANFTP